MRTPGNVETQFAGVARSDTAGAGAFKKYRRNQLLAIDLINPVVATGPVITSAANVVFDGTNFVVTNGGGGTQASAYSANGSVWTNGGTSGAQWTGNLATNGSGVCMQAVQGGTATSMVRTTNSGVSWSTVTMPSAATNFWLVAWVGGSRWLGISQGTVNQLTAVSDDNGATWSAGPNLPFSGTPKGIAVCRGFVCVVSDQTACISKDQGNTWFTGGSTVHGSGVGGIVYQPGIDLLIATPDNSIFQCSATKDGVGWFLITRVDFTCSAVQGVVFPYACLGVNAIGTFMQARPGTSVTGSVTIQVGNSARPANGFINMAAGNGKYVGVYGLGGDVPICFDGILETYSYEESVG